MVDTIFFLLLMMVFLMGYVFAGHQLFGAQVEDFSSIAEGVLTCVRMFLGTFNYAKMRRVEGLSYVLFSYSFMVLFRYVMVNMFFAIVDKHFRGEDKLRRELALRAGGPEVVEASRGQEAGLLKLFSLVKGLRGGGEAKAAGGEAGEAVDGQGGAGGDHDAAGARETALVPIGTFDQQLEGFGGSANSDDEAEEINENTVQKVKNYKHLPPEIKDWAEKTASHLAALIEEHKRNRQATGDKGLDHILQKAENAFKDEKKNKALEANKAKDKLNEQGLTQLKEIHQDQESLAWYIMRREVELKKHEERRTKKKQELDRLTDAATDIVEGGGGGMGGLQAITDGRES